jgi:dienelactone hydrolase
MSDEGFSVEPVSDARHARVQGELFLPSHPSGWGVLVLAGSSGRLDVHGARLFAREGAVALAQRWFGQPGLPDEIRDVPLELFMEGIALLESRGCSRVALLGRSRGAEAALLVAVNDTRPRAVFALSPSSVAWAGTGLDGRPSWTFGGTGVPFVPLRPRRVGTAPRRSDRVSRVIRAKLANGSAGNSPSAHSGRAHASPAHTRGRSGRRAVAVRRICALDRAAAPRPWADVYPLDSPGRRTSRSASGRHNAEITIARSRWNR